MKKMLTLIIFAMALTVVGCNNESDETTTEAAGDTEASVEVEEYKNIFRYTHIDGKNEEVQENGYVIYENENLGYVQYQVAYTSCTCRPANKNYRSLIYVEINKDGTFKEIKFDYFGDSSPIPTESGNGKDTDYWEDTYIPKFIKKTQSDIASVDAVSEATVTSENIKRILDGLMDYHIEYYGN